MHFLINSKLATVVTPTIKRLIGVLLCCSTSVFAVEWTPYNAEYHAYRNGSKLGKASQVLEYVGDKHYRLTYQSKASWLFLSDKRKEFSHFIIDEENFIPIEYSFARTGTGKDRHTHIRFDQDTAFVNDTTINHTSALDNQLYQLAMREALEKGEKQFSFDVINERGEHKPMRFELLKSEKLSLPYGEINTLKVKRLRDNNKRETFIWFAPELNYLMVRLQQFKDGDEQADIQLSDYQVAAMNTAATQSP